MPKVGAELLEKQLQNKINAIPSPKLNKRQINNLVSKNRDKDKENFEYTVDILHQRKEEAINSGDQLKKFHAISVESDERDKFNQRHRLAEFQSKFDFIKGTIPEDEWVLLEPLIDFGDQIMFAGFNEQDLHKHFKDEFEIKPKYIVKLIELLKIKKEMKKIKTT